MEATGFSLDMCQEFGASRSVGLAFAKSEGAVFANGKVLSPNPMAGLSPGLLEFRRAYEKLSLSLPSDEMV